MSGAPWEDGFVDYFERVLLTPKNTRSDYPCLIDFTSETPLIPNGINHRYKNAEEYLEKQYNILKRDYIKSVLDGIQQYERECRGDFKTINPNISVYEGVTVYAIEKNTNPRDGILHVILFSPEDEKRLIEEQIENRRFMNGQLLYIFPNNRWSSFIIATVVDGNSTSVDEKGQKRKSLKVSVVRDTFKLLVKGQYVLVEPKAFFEAYYQALKTLKFIEPSKLPMAKYLLNLDLYPCLPAYLSAQYANMFLNHFEKFVSPLVKLNESQSRALKTALTNEFTLIQGPPGTGKTHLVKSLINVLIEFKGCRKAPIFIVCSRNSSLDHVLAPLAESGRRVVRLGGQTKNGTLKECTIPKVKTKSPIKWSTFNAINSLKEELVTKGASANNDASRKLAALDEKISAFILLVEDENAAAIAKSSTDIIGATTSGAARLRYMMSLVNPEVVIVEEAAEVFESHVVSSIPQGCKHVILIGDHEQLQPKPAHNSSEKHHMHISLFERLIRNGMRVSTLTEQHRMRPEIAALISPLIYKTLTNHKSVKEYPPVKGVAKNLFFINHFIPEEQASETGSHWNKYEAQMLLALADYLLKQGYTAKEVTLLSGYKAQDIYLKEMVAAYPSLNEMTITTIDNYQGEENTIILLSLVRSRSGTIGFLKTSNRVNVALSRAKHGLFVIGNMKDLSSHSTLWQNLKQIFEKFNAIDVCLPLKCQTHGKITKAKTKKDLNKLKYGGCNSPCGVKLDCGHSCLSLCHPSEDLHSQKCTQLCKRVICPTHKLQCNKLCREECQKCMTKIVGVRRDCGHKTEVYCWNKKVFTSCMENVTRNLNCGHSLTVPCSKPLAGIFCPYPCKRVICATHKLHCNKLCREECLKCMTKIVGVRRDCGHKTEVYCWNKKVFTSCMENVTRNLNCGHSLTVPCSKPLAGISCPYPCQRSCINGHKCKKLCYEECGICMERVRKTIFCFPFRVLCDEFFRC